MFGMDDLINQAKTEAEDVKRKRIEAFCYAFDMITDSKYPFGLAECINELLKSDVYQYLTDGDINLLIALCQ